MFAHYSEDGNILFTFEGDEKSSALNGNLFLETEPPVSDETHFVDVTRSPHAIMEKSDLSVSVETEGLEASLSGLPQGLHCSAEGVTFITDDENIISFSLPGTYRIEIDGGLRHKSKTLEVSIA